MTIHKIASNDDFHTEITIRESDKHSKLVYVKFDRHYIPEEIRGCDEMFLTLEQLESLGKFFTNQASKIRNEHFENL